ncbi:29765_t:CDS:2 [Gigaspora margarita]|uniref:29765_t:CDS:1 n=1 Tax=Gigaspora margarita TaxID=4874 RepID=A0ABN7VUS6_GIGMA|nr:29765_t:CDS:2 [Gigaspora margarita]
MKLYRNRDRKEAKLKQSESQKEKALCTKSQNYQEPIVITEEISIEVKSSLVPKTKTIRKSQHRINTRNAAPIKQKPYRILLDQQTFLQKEIENMENMGVILAVE